MQRHYMKNERQVYILHMLLNVVNKNVALTMTNIMISLADNSLMDRESIAFLFLVKCNVATMK